MSFYDLQCKSFHDQRPPSPSLLHMMLTGITNMSVYGHSCPWWDLPMSAAKFPCYWTYILDVWGKNLILRKCPPQVAMVVIPAQTNKGWMNEWMKTRLHSPWCKLASCALVVIWGLLVHQQSVQVLLSVLFCVWGQVGTLLRCKLAHCFFLYQVTLVGDFTKNDGPSLAVNGGHDWLWA